MLQWSGSQRLRTMEKLDRAWAPRGGGSALQTASRVALGRRSPSSSSVHRVLSGLSRSARGSSEERIQAAKSHSERADRLGAQARKTVPRLEVVWRFHPRFRCGAFLLDLAARRTDSESSWPSHHRDCRVGVWVVPCQPAMDTLAQRTGRSKRSVVVVENPRRAALCREDVIGEPPAPLPEAASTAST